MNTYEHKPKHGVEPMTLDGINGQTQLIDGVTVDDLVTAVYHNCPKINAESVMNTFKEIVTAQLKDAEAILSDSMTAIITMASEGRETT